MVDSTALIFLTTTIVFGILYFADRKVREEKDIHQRILSELDDLIFSFKGQITAESYSEDKYNQVVFIKILDQDSIKIHLEESRELIIEFSSNLQNFQQISDFLKRWSLPMSFKNNYEDYQEWKKKYDFIFKNPSGF